MRYEKRTAVPPTKSYVQALSLSHLREGEGVHAVRFFHMKEDGQALVCAEGWQAVGSAPEGTTRLYATADDVFAGHPTNRLTDVVTRRLYADVCDSDDILFYPGNDGEKNYYAVSLKRVSWLYADGVRHYGFNIGGTAAEIHHERLFFVNGYRIYYAPPFKQESFTSKNPTLDGRGQIDSYSPDGPFVDAVSFRDYLYLFRERGLARVQADGDALNFRIEPMRFGCGRVMAGCAANCGEEIVFLTDRGLFSFDGNSTKRLKDGFLSDLDLTQYTHASAWNGQYFLLSARKEDGAPVLAVYDLQRDYARYLLIEDMVTAVAGGKAYFVRDGFVYSLEGTSTPIGGSPCSVRFSLSGEERTLEWVHLEGEGEFTLTVSTEDSSFQQRGKAEQKIHVLPKWGREITLEIASKEKDFSLRGIRLGWRKKA